MEDIIITMAVIICIGFVILHSSFTCLSPQQIAHVESHLPIPLLEMINHSRTSENPYMCEVEEIEAVDIDYAEDFEIADAIYMNQLKKGN